MQIEHKRNTGYLLAFPLIDKDDPSSFKSGQESSLTLEAWKNDGSAWEVYVPLGFGDVQEIGTSGVYRIFMFALDMDHDQVLIKVSSSVAGDTAYLFDMRTEVDAAQSVLADGVIHGGSAAELQLKHISVQQTDANKSAVNLAGNGTEAGLEIAGGDTGAGAVIAGGATGGDGIVFTSNNGHGIEATGGAGALNAGLFLTSTSSSGAGLVCRSTDGAGAVFTGNIGINVSAFGGTNSAGVNISGDGTGHGLEIAGGATGNGVTISGANGIDVTGALTGRGVNISAGSIGVGLYVAGGSRGAVFENTGTSHAILVDGGGATDAAFKVNGAADAVRLDAGGSGNSLYLGSPSGKNFNGDGSASELDAFFSKTVPEITKEPEATDPMRLKMGWVHHITQWKHVTSTGDGENKLYDSAGTGIIAEADVNDAAGVFTRGAYRTPTP